MGKPEDFGERVNRKFKGSGEGNGAGRCADFRTKGGDTESLRVKEGDQVEPTVKLNAHKVVERLRRLDDERARKITPLPGQQPKKPKK